MHSLTGGTGRWGATTTHQREGCIQLGWRQLQILNRSRSSGDQQPRRSLGRPDNRHFRERFREAMLLMEQAFADDPFQPAEETAVVREKVDSNVDSDTYGKPENK